MEKGKSRIGLSAGGPLFDTLGFPIPVPILSLDFQYGLLDKLSVGGALYITPIIFNVFTMAELNAALSLNNQQGLIPMTTFYINTIWMTNFQSAFLFLPEGGIIASWNSGKNFLLYGGVTSVFNFYPKTGGLENKDAVMFSFPLGIAFSYNNWEFDLEMRLLHPFGNTRGLVLHYIGIGEYGALAPLFSIAYNFGA